MPTTNAGTLERAASASFIASLDTYKADFAKQSDPKRADVKLLPYLAQAAVTPVWNSDLSVQEKREVIENSSRFYEAAGTAKVIDQALTLLNFDYTLTPWYEAGGEPYTAHLDIPISRAIGDDTDAALTRFINRLSLLRDAIAVNLVIAPKAQAHTLAVLVTAERMTFTPTHP